MYGSEKIKILFSFYGKERPDTYAGCTVTSRALISSTAKSLSLEYSGYKNYVASSQRELNLVKANKSSAKKEIKSLETELENIKNRKEHSLPVNDILEDVISSAFPSIRYLLKLFVLVPISEPVGERGFSKMKLTLNDKRTRLDNKSLDALMRMPFNSVTLVLEAAQQIVETWEKQRQRRILSEDI